MLLSVGQQSLGDYMRLLFPGGFPCAAASFRTVSAVRLAPVDLPPERQVIRGN